MDTRPRNSQGQFATEVAGGVDPLTTAVAYDPQRLEQRKLTLIDKLRRLRGVEQTLPRLLPQERTMLSAKLRLRELAAYNPYVPAPQQEQKRGIGKLGAMGLGLGLGIGAGVAGVKLLKPTIVQATNRAASRVTRGATEVTDVAKKAIPEAAASFKKNASEATDAFKKTAADAQDAMAIGRDLGKIYNKVKDSAFGRQVKRGAWNIAHPQLYLKEIYGEFSPKRWATEAARLRAAVSESHFMPPGQRAEFLKKARAQVTPNPYKLNRPEWADPEGSTLFERLQDLVEFSDALLKKYDPDSGRLVEFSKQEKEKLSTKQKIGVAAGLGAAALGASLLPASARLAAIQGREILHGVRQKAAATRGLKKFIKPPGVDANRGGRMVSDYIDASQAALNRGLHGKAAGAVLRYASDNPGSYVAKKIGGDFKVSHYARFRAGHKQALGHWDWEVGELYKGKRLRPGRLEKIQDEMSRGRKAVEDEMNQEMWKGGKSEAEALRHVAANTRNADAQEYFNKLAMTKAGAAKDYAKMSLAAPGLVVAGASGAYAASRRKEKK